MSHTVSGKSQLVARIRRIAGQVAAIERALENEDGCSSVLQQIAGARGAMNGLMDEVAADFIREHVAAGGLDDQARATAAEELVEVIRRYNR